MMRARPLPLAALGAALGLAGALLPAAAQDRDDRYFTLRDPFRDRGGGGGSLFRWSPPVVIEAPRSGRPMEPAMTEPQGVSFASVAEADAQRPVPAKEYIAVFGDQLADQLAQGLADTYVQDRPEVAVIRKGRANSTLVRGDQLVDWITLADDLLAGEKITIGVVMIGLNDRQPVRDDSGTHEPRSDRWRDIYVKRIDDLIAKFKSRNIPLYWVGLPAMKTPRQSQDMQYFNELFRERTARANVPFIDVWDGFVDEQGQFMAQGPAVDGQRRRLRGADGVLFTRAGTFKLAHYVEREIALFLNQKYPPVPTLPADEAPAVAPAPEARAAPGPAPAAAPRERPVAGPVVPLVAGSGPGGALAGASTTRSWNTPGADPGVTRVLLRGEAQAPVSGRADDFAWRPDTLVPPAAQTPPPAAPR